MSQQQIEVKIGGRPYKLAVESGQETRVRAVAQRFDEFVSKMQGAGTQMDRDRVLVLAGIMMSDEFLTLQQTRETEMRSLESFMDNMADRMEKLADQAGGQ